MAILKCKMCGGDLNITADEKIIECEYCGSTQTIPDGSDEKKTNLFNRANRLRMDNEFDKAAGVYESIVSEFPEEAEGYWGLVLCSYGIEYVDDSKTGKKIPTCHRTLTSSVMDDDNFAQACENADVVARGIYREEAKAIDKLQQQIIAVVENEEPYDVFICYKETDDITKQRTEDSLIAQDIYTELIKEGYKVFFSRVTLRDKAGTEYEPYIYAALKSAKIMLAIGTKFDYYDAVWVKNEWSRYISMMADDSSKHLIPCFKNLDAYDIPKEFKNLQALDMGEVTFFKNLTDNVERFIPKQTKEQIVTGIASSPTGALTKRGYIYLEDKDFVKAEEYFDKALDENPEDSQAYLGKFLVSLRITSTNEIDNYLLKIDTYKDFERAIRFAGADEKAKLESIKEKAEKKYLICCIITGLKKYENKVESKATIDDVNRLLSEGTVEAFEEGAKLYYAAYLKQIDKSFFTYDKKESLSRQTDILRLLSDNQAYTLSDIQKSKYFGFSFTTKKLEEDLKNLLNLGILEKISIENIPHFAMKGYKEKAIIKEKDEKYNKACSFMEGNNPYNYSMAIKLFKEIKDWKDSVEKISLCEEKITKLEKMLAEKIPFLEEKRKELSVANDCLIQTPNSKYPMHLGLSVDGHVYISCSDKYRSKAKNWTGVLKLSAGEFHVVGLKSDGTVCSTGDNQYGQCNVSSWDNIAQISAGGWHTVGLRTNGTVVAIGCTDDGRINVSSWSDIVKVSAGKCHTVGLKSNGTVVATGLTDGGRCNVADWHDIVNIWAFNGVTVGLKKDGTVAVVGNSIENCDVSGWTDIVDVSIGYTYMLGLKRNGIVLLTGDISYGDMNVSEWRDIVSISAKNIHAVGLCANGTVVATGVNDDGQCNVNNWRDIVAISAGNFCTLGLKTDGSIVSVGVENAQPYTYIYQWKLFNKYCDITSEQENARKAIRFRRDGLCQHCGGSFKGLFTKTCTKCGKKKDY